jgi:signal transduction histidine kinase/streptogramin lyase
MQSCLAHCVWICGHLRRRFFGGNGGDWIFSNALHLWLRFVLVFGFVFVAWGLDPGRTLTQYSHRIWGQEEGLFQPSIYSILQTSDGFLWLGTQDSLIRFDGSHFREITDLSDRPVLHGSLVRSLLEDRDGTLWAGSIGNGLALVYRDGSVKRYNASNGFVANTFCLDTDAQGSVWVCGDQGLYRFSGKNRELIPFANGARTTCESRDGTRWVADLVSGLWRLRDGRREQFPDLHLPPDGGISALTCAADGTLWVGSGVGLLHIEGNHVKAFTSANGLPDNAVSSLVEAQDGGLWIGTDDGISRLQHGELDVYRTSDGLSHSVVLAMGFDREGNLWAGTKDGLDQFTNGNVLPYTMAEGMPSNDASAVAEDSEGRLWIGTLDSGLAVFEHNRFRSITRRDGLASDRVLSLLSGTGGDLWVGTDHGLNRLRAGHVMGTARELAGQEIRCLMIDGGGTLWAGTNKGLYRYDAPSFHALPASVLEPAGVFALGQGTHGQILISTDTDRLPYVQNGGVKQYPISGINRLIACYWTDPVHHSVWMGTLGSGLLRWHDGKLAHLHVKDGLYDNRIYSILDDSRGNLWMASSKGIFRVSRDELERFADAKTRSVNSIPFSTGQLHFECRAGVQPAACKAHDGRLWFATTSGVVVVDPEHLEANTMPPPVSVTGVYIDGQRFQPTQKLSLAPSERNLEIHYAGLSFINPEKVSFRYILDGYDRDWTDAGPRRAAFFTKLPPGQYHFRVMARSADGVWSRQAAAVNFAVEPLLYQRRWFWPSTVLLLGLGITATWRLRMRQLRQRFGLVLAERTRIARELHDTLLQGLAGVTMQLQALWTRLPASKEKETLRAIIDDAGLCAAEARKSLWGLRAESGSAELFSDKLASLVKSASAEEAGTRLLLQTEPVSLDDRPEAEFQLLRIAREALSNALEHSKAERVSVTLAKDVSALSLTIADDGVGFASDRDHCAIGRFGLQGMSERAKEIGASLEVKSTPGSGTTVSVRLPLLYK